MSSNTDQNTSKQTCQNCRSEFSIEGRVCPKCVWIEEEQRYLY